MDIPHATIDTVTAWECPCCGQFDPQFSAINPFDNPLVYECQHCFGKFLAPEDDGLC